MRSLLLVIILGAACFGMAVEKDTPWKQIPADAVVLSVNGINYTRGDCDAYSKLMFELYRNRHPSFSSDKLRIAKARMRLTLRNELVAQAVMRSSLCTNEVIVSADVRKMLEHDYWKTFCTKRQTLEELRDCLDEVELLEVFDAYFERDLKVRAALEKYYHDDLVVTEVDFTNAIENVKAYNKVALATNALICAEMTNVMKRVRAGEDFAMLADRYSQDPGKEPGGALGECTAPMLASEDSNYLALIAKLKPGETTEVLETAEGYEIVRKNADVKSDDGQVKWDLSRIFFRRPYLQSEVFDENFRDDLRKERYQDLLRKIQPELIRQAKISYPCGNVFLVKSPQKGIKERNKR